MAALCFRWLALRMGQIGARPGPVVLADRLHGRPVRRMCVQAEDGRELGLGDLVWLSREDALETGESRAAAARRA